MKDERKEWIMTGRPGAQTLSAINTFVSRKRGMTLAEIMLGFMNKSMVAIYQENHPQRFAVVGVVEPDYFGGKACHVYAIGSDTAWFMSRISREVIGLAKKLGCDRITADSDLDEGYADFVRLGRGHAGIVGVRPYKAMYKMEL